MTCSLRRPFGTSYRLSVKRLGRGREGERRGEGNAAGFYVLDRVVGGSTTPSSVPRACLRVICWFCFVIL